MNFLDAIPARSCWRGALTVPRDGARQSLVRVFSVQLELLRAHEVKLNADFVEECLALALGREAYLVHDALPDVQGTVVSDWFYCVLLQGERGRTRVEERGTLRAQLGRGARLCCLPWERGSRSRDRRS